MWYASNDSYVKRAETHQGSNALLLSLLAQKVVRRLLAARGEYRIYDEDVENYTRKIMGMLVKQFGDLEKLRYKTTNTEMLPFIEKCAKQLIK